MERIKIDFDAPDHQSLARAASLLDRGQVIIFPTETLYGLVARLDRPEALKRICELKDRASKKAMPCLAADKETARRTFDPAPADFDMLADDLWPGPLTVIGRAKQQYIGPATGWGPTIGIRVPSADTLLSLVKMTNIPLAATSANPTQAPAPSSADEVAAYFTGQSDLTLFDAGELAPSKGSTVIDVSKEPPLLLRRGDFPKERIEKTLRRPLVEIEILPDENLQDLMQGPLRIIQKLKGFRYSIDPLLLAAFVEFSPRDRIIDLGSGSGVIPLILAGRGAEDVTGIEYQADLADMSQRSVTANGLAGRARIIHGDIRRIGERFEAGLFDIAVSNPPYFPVGTGHISPDEIRAASRHELRMNLKELIHAMKYLVRPGGKICLIHLATRQEELLSLMRDTQIGSCEVRRVAPRQMADANFTLVRGVAGASGETTVLPPLVVHQSRGEYTSEVKAMLNW